MSTINMPMTRQDAIDYMIDQIEQWQDENPPQETDEPDAEGTTPPPTPWHYVKGVRLDRALLFWIRVAREAFRNNPYRMPAGLHFTIILAMLGYALTHHVLGFVKALEAWESEGNWVAALVEGWLGGLIITWVFPLFLFPPLIANVEQQFAAHGLTVE